MRVTKYGPPTFLGMHPYVTFGEFSGVGIRWMFPEEAERIAAKPATTAMMRIWNQMQRAQFRAIQLQGKLHDLAAKRRK